MKRITLKISAALVVMLGLITNAYAGNACPAVSAIEQEASEYGGFKYKAVAANGVQWIGENPIADAGDLAKVVFKEAYIVNPKNFVACDYVGPELEGVRMALKTSGQAKPAGSAWVDQKQTDATVLPRCAGVAPGECKFK
ncbi:hypothetical protein [Pseudomonas sp. TSRC2-2]|uniref:hypothetical protein n=1 Tax=unclassified Pseudomonas TaxID=196821 RepID=UPI003CF847F7